MTDDTRPADPLATALHDALYASMREFGWDPDLRIPATIDDEFFLTFSALSRAAGVTLTQPDLDTLGCSLDCLWKSSHLYACGTRIANLEAQLAAASAP